MDSDLAEEFKTRGNEAYSAKRFEDALVLYEKAIEANPNNYIYYNNCAAAHYELKHYDKAIEEATKSIAVCNNAKAHVRMGTALWAQKRYEESKREFDLALLLEPNNTVARQNCETLNKILHPSASSTSTSSAGTGQNMGNANSYRSFNNQGTPNNSYIPVPTLIGGEFSSVESGTISLIIDAAVIVIGSLTVPTSIFAPELSWKLWQGFLLLVLVQQVAVMRMKGLWQLSWSVIQHWFEHFSSLLFGLVTLAWISNIRPVVIMVIFIVIYSAIDLVDRRAEVQRRLGPLYRYVDSLFVKGVANKVQMQHIAASLESMLIFTIMFTGGAIFTLGYIQYGKNRFQRDTYVQLACRALRLQVTNVLTMPWVPATVNVYAQKFFDFIYKMAHQSM